MQTTNILGVNISKETKKQTLNKIRELLNEQGQHTIFTPNPEILLKTIRDREYKDILNKSSLNLPDGAGLQWAANFLCSNIHLNKSKYLNIPILFTLKHATLLRFAVSKNYQKKTIPERISGVDTFKEIIKIAEQKKYSIFLLGARDGVAAKAAQNLKEQYPNLRITGTYSGSPKKEDEEKIQYLINDTKPDILFVAYGAPQQEKWIDRNLKNLPTVKLAMGVGGTFDFISKNIQRAPKELQESKLEWLWRLKQEPQKRKKRITNAVFKFPHTVFLEKLYKHRPYRKNVLAVIINKNNEFLILNNSYLYKKHNEKHHWQFLQGGKRPFESDEKGLKREVKEEMGSDKIRIIAKSKQSYSYLWPIANLRLKRPFKGQKQNIYFVQYLGNGDDVKVDPKEHSEFKWVPLKDLLKNLHPVRHQVAHIILDEFNSQKILEKTQ